MASTLVDSSSGLIATRAIMGVGGAFIMPATLSLLTNVFRDPKERARAIAIWAGCAGLGVAIGPVVGGLLLEHFSWHSVFLHQRARSIVLAIVAGWFLVPTSRDPNAPRIDLPGAALSIGGLVALVWSLIEAPRYGWTDPVTLIGFAIAAVLLTAFIALGAAHRPPDAGHAVLPQPPVQRRQLGHHADVLRHVRLVVPAHAVPAVRDGLQPARGRRRA